MYFFLFLLLLIVTCTTSIEGQKKNCNVSPKDLYILEGSDTQILCESFCVDGRVYWMLNNKTVNESWSSSVNSTHHILSLKNFTLSNATVVCHHTDTKGVLGGTIVRTYAKPTVVDCIWHYKNGSFSGVPQLFTCTWEHEVSQKINYTLFVISWYNTSLQEMCSSEIAKTCTAVGSKHVTLAGNYSVTVRAKAKHWEIDSDPYKFYPRDILQISPPKLKLHSFTTHLLAECTVSIPSKKYYCQVKYSKVGDERQSEVLNKTLEASGKGNISIENIESCIYYKVSARCAWDKAPWSKWSRAQTILSQLNKSNVKTHLWRKVTEPEKNGTRKVYAMWTEIPSACHGTFTYFIRDTVSQDNGIQVDYNHHSCGNSICTFNVNEEAHRLKLIVFHNEEMLSEDSVYVPAVEETGLPQVSNMQTSTIQGVISLCWDAPSPLVRGYMIDWTHDGYEYYWKESNCTSTTLEGLLDKVAYNITVTPLFEDKTGLGTQVVQICTAIAAPANFSTITVEVTDKTASVRWMMQHQDLCSENIVRYIVFYGTGQGPQLNITVNSTNKEVLLKNLIPYTHYNMYIKAVAQTGASESDVRYFSTKSLDPKLVIKLLIIGSITIFLVLSTVICCAVQYRKFLENPLPDPGLSSVALWPSGTHQKGMFPFRLFNYPSESLCARVYLEDSRTTSSPDVCQEEYSGLGFASKSNIPKERPDDPEEAFTQSSSRECTELLANGSGQLSPYRSQGSVESPTQSYGKESKCLLPVNHQQLTASLAMYVTVDIFEQDQCR
ncbi:interleukin-31 receptor subunit alpha-like isoform X2 [Corythoichthys intestinalis]|uniref:interleukin-31 receptor subunit alpha-like isoform X2 n=1 Tax=Corythoichthys intestinalis TaxID=161448 RepID=UPI0025A58144|nr:interleukin-31 receptor subunit alpha-like isoform X2 [Corythoichthys intestinalis]